MKSEQISEDANGYPLYIGSRVYAEATRYTGEIIGSKSAGGLLYVRMDSNPTCKPASNAKDVWVACDRLYAMSDYKESPLIREFRNLVIFMLDELNIAPTPTEIEKYDPQFVTRGGTNITLSHGRLSAVRKEELIKRGWFFANRRWRRPGTKG